MLPLFKNLTKWLEGNANKKGTEGSHGAIWETVKAMDMMYQHLQVAGDRISSSPDSFHQHYKTGVDCGWIKLLEFYTEINETPIYRAAMVLHPRYKYDYFEQNWKKERQWISRMRADVRQFYEEYETEYRLIRNAQSEIESSLDEDDNEFESWGDIRTDFRKTKRIRLENELESFTNSGVKEKDKKIKDPLTWWLQHESDYPVLSKMAMDLFSIPAMSSECERVFSQAKKLITDERNRLGHSTVQGDECQKQWLKTGLMH